MLAIISSCEDERYGSTESDMLIFPVDTLKFDTIFTTQGSATKSLRIVNPTDDMVLLSKIEMGKGSRSKYRLNINGVEDYRFTDVPVSAFDSLFVFVVLEVDPNGNNQPMIISDSILFETKTVDQSIHLQAWGQDFHPIEQEVLETQTWLADKPYLITQYAYVDTGAVLTIEPGCQIFFSEGSSLYVKGTLVAKGTSSSPILFSGSQREDVYKNLPNQWQGIMLFPNHTTNIFENVEIRNANTGLQIGSIEDKGTTSVSLNNVKIEQMGYAGIFALNSKIHATNTLVANCGFYNVALLVGGDYQFDHCTIANGENSFIDRQTPAVVLSNFLRIQDGKQQKNYFGDLVRSDWRNSIIWGELESEIDFGSTSDKIFNYRFDHCLLKLSDTIDVTEETHFNAIIKNEDPQFKNAEKLSFELDSLSPALNRALPKIEGAVLYDIKGVSRLSDKQPDLGAYERVEKKKPKK